MRWQPRETKATHPASLIRPFVHAKDNVREDGWGQVIDAKDARLWSLNTGEG